MNLAPSLTSLRIRDRLTLLLLVPMGLLLITSVYVNYETAQEPANHAYDHALADTVVDLSGHLKAREDSIGLDVPVKSLDLLRPDQFDRMYFQVLDPKGLLVAGEPDIPKEPDRSASNPRLYDGVFRNSPVRVASYRAATAIGEVTVRVAETTHERERVARRIAVAMLVPNVLLIVGTLLLVYFGVRAGLIPLVRLSSEIASRSPQDLRPIQSLYPASELHPLVGALNRLLEMLREASESQQKFVANAAHQLRTPLAGLQAQLQLAEQENSTETKQVQIGHALAAAQRLSHLANQLLSLAKVTPEAALAQAMTPLDLRDVVESCASSFVSKSDARNIDLGFEVQTAQVTGARWLVRELLSNLMDNALEYTPADGIVTVRCGRNQAGVFLEVEDNGPGIPVAERAKVLDRFYRMAGSPGGGSGLGLAIVKEIATIHRANLEISDARSGKGCLVRVTFPATEDATLSQAV
jgi:two-component system sensor histidine kinase TctE